MPTLLPNFSPLLLTSVSSVLGKTPMKGLVSTWLNGIGLHDAIPAFEAAGIVTPSALADLQVTDFEALGLTDPEDRRKLFFLVQRIKLAVARENASVSEEVGAVLADTLKPPDSEKYLEKEPRMAAPKSSATMTEETPSVQRPPKSPSSKARASSRPSHVTNRQSRPTSSRRGAAQQQETSRNNRSAAETEDTSEDALDDSFCVASEQQKDDDDSDWEGDSGESADDELSSQAESTSRRSSARLAEKRQSSSSSNHHRRRSSSLVSPKAVGRRSTSNNGRRISAAEHADDTSASDTNPTSPNRKPAATRRPGTGVPVPSKRPSTLGGKFAVGGKAKNNPKSWRTGKQLSAIPSNAVLPMSPLVELPAKSKLVARHGGELAESRGRTVNRPHRRASSFGGSDSESTRGGGGSDSDVSSTSSRRSLGSSSASSRRSLGSSENSHPRGRRKSLSLPRRSASSEFKPREDVASRAAARPSLSPARGRVTTIQRQSVEGASWKCRIAKLREDNDTDHELFGTDHLQQNHAGDEEEMRIRVVVRKRPMSKEEVTVAGDVDVIHPLDYGSFGKILVYHPRTRVDLTKEIETVPFAFDHVFDERSSNADIYQRSVRNLIPSLFEGQWASIFAYGQTGSGKTFTMMGSGMTGLQQNGSSNGKNDPSNFGLYYMAALDVFDSIQTPAFEDFLVGTSMFEIYGGKLFDLLNERAQVKCLEDSKGNVCFPGLSEHEVASADDLIALIEQGATNRSTGTTSRNADSSRSHAVLQLHLRKNDGRRRNDEFSRLSFIDLAGSERGADTSNSCRATRLEGAEINTSLLALKEVIRALATGDSLVHVPFRGSKLTQVLKQSFVGKNCRSVMIACISPNIGNCEQTLNTLRYADRVKERNPETGELAPAKPTNGPKSHHQSQSSQLSLDSSSHSNTSDVLDDLLATPKNEKGGLKDRLAAENLVATHKEAMAVMLSMVKDEMSLVKKADTDREGLDEYVRQVENFQDKQLGLIATIREQLLQYRLAKAGAWANANGPDSDDSFEDLRD